MSTSTSNPKVSAIIQSVQDSYTELSRILDSQLAQLQATRLYQPPDESEWTLMQNLAHIAEFMPYWAGEIEKLVATPGTNFGRTQQDEGRLRGISEHAQDSLLEIRSFLPAGYARLQGVLATLTDKDLELTGAHVRFGEQTVEWFINDFVTQHLINHLDQIHACLSSVAK